MNRLIDEDTVHGIGGVEHNLTYSYSSSEDSLNESFSINFSQKLPRSAETSLKRPVKLTNMKTEIMLQPSRPSKHMYEKVPNIYNRPTYKQSSPRKPVDSPDYLQTMYADMDEIDRKLQMVTKIECEGIVSNAKFDEDDHDYSEKSRKSNKSDNQMKKMEDMMSDLNQQSEELHHMFR